jgi:hypothetical protein
VQRDKIPLQKGAAHYTDERVMNERDDETLM